MKNTLIQAVALLLASFNALHAADSRPTNIVFIMADDLGWRDLGCFGSTYHQTPNLDRLAARGVKFTQAYAANPLCSPTRSSILTGLWPARTGITAPVCHLPEVVLEKRLAKGNPKTRVLVAQSVTRLSTDYLTLPEILREAGYATGHFGKWHLGKAPHSPREHGFDVDFPAWPGPGPAGSYIAPWAPAFPQQGKLGEHIEDTTAEAAAQFIRQHRDEPFFLNYWLWSVHAPYDAKDELVAKYRALADPANPQRNAVYAAMVQSLDEAVGRVLTALDECGLTEKTAIVFFSDNGGVSWDDKAGKGHKSVRFQADMTSPPTSNLPLRNGKASLYEGGVREPCIVVWPGITKPGTTDDTIIQSVDWLPTLLDIAGVPLPQKVKPDGLSLAPLLRGETNKLDRKAIFTHFPHDTPASGQKPGTSVRRGDWKLIRLFANEPNGSDTLELFNLRDDVGESKNLAGDKPELVRELNALIDTFLEQTDAVIPKLNPAFQAAASAVPEKNADPLQGWVARNAKAVVSNGILTLTGQGAAPFLGIGGGGAQGPIKLQLRARCAQGGAGKLEWIPAGKTQTDALSVPFQLAGGDWEELTATIPADALPGIIRVYLPAQQQDVEVDSIELQTTGKPRRWDF
ncbi:MAG: N-acetylgalactosamine 6-sulfate sulfatase [Pirellula sp.]|nr:N-acetylgalactosamine 6-sulfate sulfatase [Pirellula sp.]